MSSTECLIENLVEKIETIPLGSELIERPLSRVEKAFLLYSERGDCASVKRIIEQYEAIPEEFDINCVDPLNRSALISAIENENIELIKLLLDKGIKVKDGLLHAIKEEYVEGVETLLNWEETHHVENTPYSWEMVDRAGATFTSDITPLILAAHRNHYEIIKLLLDRGASLPMPHDIRCGCDECVSSSSGDSLRYSQSRINAYKALSSSSLISLSSSDPVLTAFELSWDLRRLSRMETEFRSQYNEMKENVLVFATSLLDYARTSNELEIMLNYNPDGGDIWEMGERQTLERLKLAIKYKQKGFIAHPNVQQLLASIWYEGVPGFRRKGLISQSIEVCKLGMMFPVYCTGYMMAPNSNMGLFIQKPFVKFIVHSASYVIFLTLLGAASQRVEILALEFIGIDWIQEIVKEWKRKERGSFFGIAECGVILYVASLIWGEIKSLWCGGIMEYVSDLWNIVDFVTNIFYVLWFTLRLTACYICWRDEHLGKRTWYPREEWDSFEPMLLSEGAFAAGMIFSFLKLVHVFSVNPHLGPLQISLGRMIIDIVKFFFIYTLVLFAFGCGLNQLLWYYAELEKNLCYHLHNGLPDYENQDKACQIWRRYANLFETSQSLFWASFGLVDIMTFDLTGIKGFTRFWALLMFGSYSVINVIVLLNMLIAMMSNSYQMISERSDVEWKFARSRLWISYFDDDDILPPPFNIIPTPHTFLKMFCKSKPSTLSFRSKSRDLARERYEHIMKLLVRRYITAEQRKRDEFAVTEDDIMEVRQDISTLRYELIDILRKNGMDAPNVALEDMQISGRKGKTMERRLLKDFHIGIVERIVTEFQQNEEEPKNIFGQIARVVGQRNKSKRKNWNEFVQKNKVSDDPIGSAQEVEELRKRRQSLRQHIMTHAHEAVKIEDEKLLEYNPNLGEIPRGARLAYVKFLSKKIEEDYTKTKNVEDLLNRINEDMTVIENQTSLEPSNLIDTCETTKSPLSEKPSIIKSVPISPKILAETLIKTESTDPEQSQTPSTSFDTDLLMDVNAECPSGTTKDDEAKKDKDQTKSTEKLKVNFEDQKVKDELEETPKEDLDKEEVLSLESDNVNVQPSESEDTNMKPVENEDSNVKSAESEDINAKLVEEPAQVEKSKVVEEVETQTETRLKSEASLLLPTQQPVVTTPKRQFQREWL